MFELIQIAKHNRFYERIFPIVLDDAEIYDPVDRINYISYWDEKTKKLNNAIKTIDSAANLQGIREDIDLYTEIRATIAALTNILKDMNTLTPDDLAKENFKILINAIEQKMAE